MANSSVLVPANTPSQSPYKLDIDQTLKASKALLHHVQKEAKRLQQQSSKTNLFQPEGSDSESESSPADDQPIWLNLTTKHHIVDKNRLKPSKISVQHSLNKSSNLSICLIVADPQRAVKNAVADPAFPSSLSSRITRIIGFSKLKARYYSFESRRKLLSEHDIFLADDRIITRLAGTLGKIFYKGTAKRPIPISIAKPERVDGKKVKPEQTKKDMSKGENHAAINSPALVAKEIESALNSVPISLKPGTSVAVRAGLASFTPQQLADNVVAVAQAVIDKHVAKGWRNVKSIHIKSPTSTAIPIWLADDMWVNDENAIKEELNAEPGESIEDAQRADEEKEKKRKRKPASATGPQAGMRKKTKTGGSGTTLKESEADQAMEKARKTKLEEQKRQVFKEGALAA